jgi:MerR family transcriptional regulator, thiopeptide resistance regulator
MTSSSYAAEARRRWGHTEAFRESQRRAAGYGPADWTRVQAEARDIALRAATVQRAGLAASSTQAMDVAEEHREHLSRWFYDCGPSMHRALADLYVGDERFTAHYEETAPGLAAFFAAAIRANADRLDDRDV